MIILKTKCEKQTKITNVGEVETWFKEIETLLRLCLKRF